MRQSGHFALCCCGGIPKSSRLDTKKSTNWWLPPAPVCPTLLVVVVMAMGLYNETVRYLEEIW